MQIKEVFEKAENGVLTYEEFAELAKGASFVDLKEGNYVSKQKYDDEIGAKNLEIENLNSTISTRDNDFAELQQKLEAAGTDADQLAKVTGDFNSLKTKYDDEVKNYKAQLKKQAYEFAVKQHAGELKFTCEAAKRDYITQALAKDMKMENDSIIGITDFDAVYNQSNKDAFITEDDLILDPEPAKPRFIDSTPGGHEYSDPTGGFADAFHFTEIHPAGN